MPLSSVSKSLKASRISSSWSLVSATAIEAGSATRAADSPRRAFVPVHPRERVAMLTAVRSLVAGKYTMWKEELWTKAVPEQQRLTIQLVRNTIYFTLSTVLITVFGDQLAV